MAARVFGIRQKGIPAGWYRPRGTRCASKRDEVRGAQAVAMTSRKKSAVANCHAGGAHYEKKELRKASLASGVQDPQASSLGLRNEVEPPS